MTALPRQRLCKWGFWAGLAGITGAALGPFAGPELTPSHGDKLNHILAFLVLGLLGAGALVPDAERRTQKYGVAPRITALFVGLLGYGIGLELVQGLFPARQCALGDVLADGVGIGLGLGLASLIRWAETRKKAQ
ncbi:VanZ family protein [Desulfohalobium retbaense]|uniref:VanZ family protein n=1 Tax=Desulfohalobium retbaense (strain ATCC 49708 / DSM 5692 / JCM 16813 / HR100) TaxID=485915 RepID=C8X4N7_DESRD|nr:VanZ family protein [Desulfohalobium retbaense]ACV69260.1 VanZ family protein [Desulfohalobium retbaense DSM 5692]